MYRQSAGTGMKMWSWMVIGLDNTLNQVKDKLAKVPGMLQTRTAKIGLALAAGVAVMTISGSAAAGTLDGVTQKLTFMEQVTQKLNAAWDWLKQNWMTVLGVLGMLGVDIIGIVSGAIMPLITAVGGLTGALGILAAGFAGWQIGTWLYNSFAPVRELAITVVGFFVELPTHIETAYTAVKGLVSRMIELFANLLSKILEVINAIISLPSKAVDAAGKAVGAVADTAANAGGAVLSAPGDLGRWFSRKVFPVGERAAGGPVSSGSPYLVGERGPELFVPGHAGRIIPNASGGAAMAGGGSNISFGDIIINVQGGGGAGGEFDHMALAQMVREQIRLAVDEANRRSMYDI